MLAISISLLFGSCQILWLAEITNTLLFVFFSVSVITLLISFKYRKNYLYCIAAFCIGGTISLVHSVSVKNTQLNLPLENSITIKGKILGLPIQKQDKDKFLIELEPNELGLKKVLSTWYKNSSITDLDFKSGQLWLFELKLKPSHHNFNPGSYDYSKWLFRNRIDSLATIKSAEFISNESDLSFDFLTRINRLRLEISNLIDVNIKSERVQALVKALTIGDKSQISFQDSILFRQTGTAHIIAISGLHIGLIALFGILVGRLVFMLVTFQRVNRQFYEVLFAFSFALIYTFLAGFSISTIRALIMLSVFLLSYLNKIPMSRWNSWAIALIIILLLDPLNVLDEGFWLSFAAVAILIFAFSGKKQDFNKLLSFIKAQLILLIGLMPLSILIFGNINLQTPLSNFIVLPIASFLLIPLIFLSLLISVFSKSLAQHLFNLSEVVSNYFFIILDKLNEINYLSISINSSIMTFFIVTFVSITLLLPRLFRWKYLVILLFLPIYFKPIKKLEYDEFKVNVLDVGQGLSMVIETKNHVLIYDTGAKFESGFSMANSVVVPFLNKSQIQKVDRLILSHDDNDHSGGMEVLSNYFNDIEIYTVNDDFKTCDSNLSWAWDGVKFEVFSPYQIIPYLGNNSSCVLKISNLKTSILLTGDIEEPVEYRLIHNNLIDIQSDVLIVPHHGSRTSSSIEFIQKVNPKVAINSSGFANQFNHPHPLIKQRYMDEGIDFIDTQTSGNIQISFKNSNFNITEYKKSNNKIWFNNPQKTSKVLKYFHERLE